MATYANRPAASGLHAKLIREARERSEFCITATYGIPNHVNVIDAGLFIVWHGHRDLLPAEYKFASDPSGALTRPASD